MKDRTVRLSELTSGEQVFCLTVVTSLMALAVVAFERGGWDAWLTSLVISVLIARITHWKLLERIARRNRGG